ncbi:MULTISPECIES: hypothetical protein [unclassified Cupriavidus]|jgi:hypothetical protein|uniref:hypothetical protein n=1 Tax=unclassified Cupriavidus TaxID=2640874 RepID=UPI001C006F0A|nr:MULTISPECIES: hypothetical protein [unclassified Cupriavidus]MCA3184611.1 hypothetical protein [Cupriavidus sp.]MCA3192046.1 hypothetical protein [Cupriavidus sp.]MCA3197791.1 hypothetical protein [Cupriavidus sp.]MCA3202843.1 hypothetical protein [Cupriavidus sp.]MCA3210395.1 hypothetical protein [Cupriavidus sp.]
MLLRRHVNQFALLTVLLAGLTPFFHGHAQTPPPAAGDAAINDAISDAVRQGSTRFQPTPSTPPSLADQCDQLALQIGETPRRSYKPSNAPVENSQGNEVSTVERDRTRRQLQKVYQEKCMQ